MIQGIYGMGRFGSFWSTVIADAGEVLACNRSDRPLPAHVRRVDESGLAASDTIWLCSSISSIREVCENLAPQLRPGTLVIDTCSVKVHPITAMTEELPPDISIMGTHPMFGPDSARNGLAGLAMVLCPVRVDPTVLAWWKSYFEAKGLRVYIMSPDEHDLAAARTQGVTHFVGRFLAELGLEDSPIATVGFRKIKEVMEQTCNDPWQLFLELQHLNPHGDKVRAELRGAFERLWTKGNF